MKQNYQKVSNLFKNILIMSEMKSNHVLKNTQNTNSASDIPKTRKQDLGKDDYLKLGEKHVCFKRMQMFQFWVMLCPSQGIPLQTKPTPTARVRARHSSKALVVVT